MPVGNKKKKLAQKMRTGKKASLDDVKTRVTSNPFEVRKNKSTHAPVLGRVVKGNNRNVLLSNEKATTQREKSLGDEYEKSSKKNVFKDRRFGASDNVQALTEEEKMYKKLEIQRKKMLKKQKYALGDDNEEEALTHMGEELNVNEAFNNLHNDFEEDELDEIDPNMMMRTSFKEAGKRGSKEGGEKAKTQKEIMMEIIEKSKMYREQRKREAEEISNEIENVDAMMDDIHSLLSFSNEKGGKKVAIDDHTRNDDDYDRLTSQMYKEMKGKASDRQKTQEELDKEEMERLAEMEKAREERMHGVVKEKERNTGDIQDESIVKKKTDVDTVLDAIEEEAKEEDGKEDYDLLFGKEEEEEEEECATVVLKEKKEREEMIDSAKKEIPYVIDIPRGIPELCELLNEYVEEDDSVSVILTRIVKNNNPNVKKESKNDFINLYRNILSIVEVYCANHSVSSYVIQSIQSALVLMHKYIPENVVIIWVDILQRMKNRLFSTIRTPRLSDILLLHMAMNLFCVTDYHNVVINSACLLIGRSLLHCSITSSMDVILVVYLTGIAMEYQLQSHKCIPEMYSMFSCLFRYLLLGEEEGFILPGKEESIHFVETGKIESMSISDISSGQISRNQLVSAVITIAESIIECNKSNPAGYVYLRPICYCLDKCDISQYPTVLQERIQSLENAMIESVEHILQTRHFLDLQKEVLKPVFISYAPSYGDHFTPGKILHPNKEHIQTRELKNKVKREKRGIERELRREAEVIRDIRDNEKKDVDEQQTKKLKEVMNWLEEDQANYNKAVKKGVATGGGSKIHNNLK